MCLRPLMLGEVALGFEVHAAQVTRVGTLVGVRSNMFFEHTWLRTHRTAIFATVFALFARILSRPAFRGGRQARILLRDSIELTQFTVGHSEKSGQAMIARWLGW